jgi:hypothetical protein
MTRTLKQMPSGLVVPADAPEKPKVTRDYVQRDLMADQLPRYLARLNDEHAELEAVFNQTGFWSGMRFAVSYRHHEELSCEVRT